MRFSKLFSSLGFILLFIFLLLLLVGYNGHKRYQLFHAQHRQAMVDSSSYTRDLISSYLISERTHLLKFTNLLVEDLQNIASQNEARAVGLIESHLQSYFDNYADFALFENESNMLQTSNAQLREHFSRKQQSRLSGDTTLSFYQHGATQRYDLHATVYRDRKLTLIVSFNAQALADLLNRRGGDNEFYLVQGNIDGPVQIDTTGLVDKRRQEKYINPKQKQRLGSALIVPGSGWLLVTLYPEGIFSEQIKLIATEVIFTALFIIILFVLLYRRIRKESTRSFKAEIMMREIFDNIPGVVFKRHLDARRQIDYPFVSTAAREILGMDAKKLLRDADILTRQIHPDDKERVLHALETSAVNLSALKLDYRILTQNNQTRWVRENASPIHDENWDVVWHGVILDITELKNIEDELRHSQKMDSIGQLAAGIAHEINTPTQFVSDNVVFLRDAFNDLLEVVANCNRLVAEENHIGRSLAEVISELAEKLEDADADFLQEEIPQAIEQTQEGLERVKHIVRAMKEFSHPGSTLKTRIDINHVIDNAVTIARNEWKYVSTMELELADNLPLIDADAQLLGQVLLNMIVNAAHAIDALPGHDPNNMGKITISTHLLKHHIAVSISDTGAGIPENIQVRIFEPFFTTKEVGKGSGQGLAIAYSAVVDQHNGSIEVDSVVGKGTTFIIKLPLPEEQG